ncbi:4Fe-4S binding protein [Candidatus Sumerlaeota bacterium]|nr:4Fe-4S binding protein [Candidatus Sumerlaeota bacterium]
MAAVINPDKCTKCQDCVSTCPVECIVGGEGVVPQIKADECVDCAACESACSAEAISME